MGIAFYSLIFYCLIVYLGCDFTLKPLIIYSVQNKNISIKELTNFLSR